MSSPLVTIMVAQVVSFMTLRKNIILLQCKVGDGSQLQLKLEQGRAEELLQGPITIGAIFQLSVSPVIITKAGQYDLPGRQC